jgi:zinc D-Ala-D-Ala carboxypeptidase
MRTGRRAARAIVAGISASLVLALAAPASAAYEFTRTLQEGDHGPDVRQLKIRVAGWFPRADQTRFPLGPRFNRKTTRAVSRFQAHHGLSVDGVAGPATFDVLGSLEKDNGSTTNFGFWEFRQNRNARCGAQANAYANSFRGGMVAPRRVRMYVRRMMWRLEALRAKGRDNPIGVNSAFRSVPYNTCIGGAGASQHMFGTAADVRQANIDNRTQRNHARGTAFTGIGCYSSMAHNHLDLRLENPDLPSSRFWWWPAQDRRGRDLDHAGRLCWGEPNNHTAASAEHRTTATVLGAVEQAVPGAGSLVPTIAEIEAFKRAGEPSDLRGAD